MTNSQDIIGRIRFDRRIYTNKKSSLYYAYLYCKHNDYIDNINSAILDAFQLIHSPLGLHIYGSQEETIRQAMKSISILQGHINYLAEAIGLTSRYEPPPSPAPAMVTPQNTEKTTANTIQEASQEENFAFNLLNDFSLD